MDAAPTYDLAVAPHLRDSVLKLAKDSDPFEVIASAQMDKVFNVRYRGTIFTVGYDERRLITYIATVDPHFSTGEGIRVGSSISQVRATGAEAPWPELGWAFHTELGSGWSAAFIQGRSNTEGPLGNAVVVRWLFKRWRPPA